MSWCFAENWPAIPRYTTTASITAPPKTCAPWKPVSVKYVVPNGVEPIDRPSLNSTV